MSPFLWLLHLNPFVEKVGASLLSGPTWKGGVVIHILIYADDIVCVLAKKNVLCPLKAANVTATTSKNELLSLGLGSEDEKSQNFMLPPNYSGDSLFRRSPKGTQTAGPAITQAQPQGPNNERDNT